MVFEVEDFLPAARMREILLRTQRLFADNPERRLYFTVVAGKTSSRCVGRLYPRSPQLNDSLPEAALLFARQTARQSEGIPEIEIDLAHAA